MERVVSATEARVHFGEMMRRVVEDEEAVIVERVGKPQMVLISLERYEQYKALTPGKSQWEAMLQEVHELLPRELGDQVLPPPDEIVREMREERDVYTLGEGTKRVDWRERIIADPNILVGKPVVKGTRISVEFIVGLLAQGWPEDEIVRNYPGLAGEDIRACLAYATDALQAERIYPIAA